MLSTLNPDSAGLLNADRLRLLKKDAVLVNTARGAIIDEAALHQVACERPDLRLVLDTFMAEPLPDASPLRELPNVILTPHQVGHTQESFEPGWKRRLRISAGFWPQNCRSMSATPKSRRNGKPAGAPVRIPTKLITINRTRAKLNGRFRSIDPLTTGISTTGIGATSPFAQACLNDRLPPAYLPLVRRGKFVRNHRCEGRGDHLCFEKADEWASDGILAALPTF